jgi:hypothetical protein
MDDLVNEDKNFDYDLMGEVLRNCFIDYSTAIAHRFHYA